MFQDLAGLMQRVRFEIWDEADACNHVIDTGAERLRQIQAAEALFLRRAAQSRAAAELSRAATELSLQQVAQSRAAAEQARQRLAQLTAERDRVVREARAAREAMEDATPRWQRTV
jgi:hypothetical protein